MLYFNLDIYIFPNIWLCPAFPDLHIYNLWYYFSVDHFKMASGEQSQDAAFDMTTSEKVIHWPFITLVRPNYVIFFIFINYCHYSKVSIFFHTYYYFKLFIRCKCFWSVLQMWHLTIQSVLHTGGGTAKPGFPHFHRRKTCHPQTGFHILK